MKLDDIDKQIIARLQSDSKLNIKALASELNLTKTPVYERIKRLEKEGIIERYVAVLNKEIRKKMMVVFCSVALESQKLEEIQRFSKDVSELPEVLECYLMGGSSDFLLKVVVKDLNDYHHFSSGKLAALSNVGLIKSTFVLNEIKHSSVYPINE